MEFLTMLLGSCTLTLSWAPLIFGLSATAAIVCWAIMVPLFIAFLWCGTRS